MYYLVHIPHAGTFIPQEYLDDYCLDKNELTANIYEYADLYTDELFDEFYKKFGGVKSKYSRLFFDAERFEDDSKEEMYKFGLGWFYENAILEKKPLRNTKHKEEIKKFYKTHHENLNRLTKEKLGKFNKVTIIDAHSFSNRSYWFFKKSDFPDICIGFDEFHKDEELIEIIKNEFKEYEIAENYPYSGSIVPLEYYQKEEKVKSVMIEINKRIYLEDDNITKGRDFEKIKEKLMRIANRIS